LRLDFHFVPTPQDSSLTRPEKNEFDLLDKKFWAENYLLPLPFQNISLLFLEKMNLAPLHGKLLALVQFH